MKTKNLQYGVKRNLTFERAMKQRFENSTFTSRMVEKLYAETHPNDGALPGMNARNFLASAVRAGVVIRYRRNCYRCA